jgi:hypothetical protein
LEITDVVRKGPKAIARYVGRARAGRQVKNWLRGPIGPWWGGLRRVRPINPNFGLHRGQPIDRFYIEEFLKQNSRDIHGDVLEIADNDYTLSFGSDNVSQSHVLHVAPGNPRATLIGDLVSGSGVPQDAFDCIILTQTLNCVYDVKSVIRTGFRSLKVGGVLLVTIPGISQITRHDMDRWGDFWRFTSLCARRLFDDVFGVENVTVNTYGNVLASIALLHGLVVKDLRRKELDHYDPDYELIIAIRAVKPSLQDR